MHNFYKLVQHLYLCLLFHSSVVYLYLLCFPCLGGILLVLFFRDRTCWRYWPVLLCAYSSLHSAFLSVTSSPFLENILCFSFSCSSNCKFSSLISNLLSKYKRFRLTCRLSQLRASSFDVWCHHFKSAERVFQFPL